MLTFDGDVFDEPSAERFIWWCEEHVGLGFHPDTPFADYVSLQDGSRCYTDHEARILNELLAKAFRYCDPYAVALAAVHQRSD